MKCSHSKLAQSCSSKQTDFSHFHETIEYMNFTGFTFLCQRSQHSSSWHVQNWKDLIDRRGRWQIQNIQILLLHSSLQYKRYTQRNTADSPSIALCHIYFTFPLKYFWWLSVLLPHNYLLNFMLYFHILSQIPHGSFFKIRAMQYYFFFQRRYRTIFSLPEKVFLNKFYFFGLCPRTKLT